MSKHKNLIYEFMNKLINNINKSNLLINMKSWIYFYFLSPQTDFFVNKLDVIVIINYICSMRIIYWLS